MKPEFVIMPNGFGASDVYVNNILIGVIVDSALTDSVKYAIIDAYVAGMIEMQRQVESIKIPYAVDISFKEV